MVIIILYNSKTLLSPHYFLTPQFQNFTNMLIEIFGVSNPTFLFIYFFFFEIFEKLCVDYIQLILLVIILLQCYLLQIFVSIRRLLQLIVCIGVTFSSHLKTMTPSFVKPLLKSANYQSPFFKAIDPHPPTKRLSFHAPRPQIK